MFILINDNCRIYKHKLVNDYTYKGIHIYSKNSLFYIELKNDYHFADNTKIKQLEYGQYNICINDLCYNIQLYAYKDDVGINDFGIFKTVNFVIANNNKANIKSFDPNLANYYLVYKDGYLLTNFEVAVNSKKYDNQIISYGDVIEYLGIKIFYYGDFLYINNFYIENRLEKYKTNNALIKYSDIKRLNNYYIPNVIDELVIDDLREYVTIRKTNNFDLVKSLLPNVIMCIAMSTMAFINYNSNSSNNDGNILYYIIMPISMLLTSVLIPAIFIVIANFKYKKDNRNSISEYLIYLNTYENNLKNNIKKYIDNLNSHFFNLFDSKKMIFYLNQNSDDFLKLSIGKIIVSKDVHYKKTNIKQIDDKLSEIENVANNIDNYPLFLDLKKHRIVTVVCKNADKYYYFNKYLLELAYKHHYDDINIGIYSKNSIVFDNVYNLPHLFLNKERLTLDDEQQLQLIDQSNLNKPLVLFIYDRCNYTFHNENIYQIYLSDDINNVCKNSNVIVEHRDNTGYLYDDNKRKFNYLIESIDFSSYFAYLGRFKHLESSDINFQFKDIFGDELYLNDDKHSLKSVFAYNNEPICLDLHESKQGPHGLIGGSTGSGKSELIVSMLLALCIRYTPEYLNIVLIDYKGGGIQDSLTYNNMTIPHIVASVSNLQNNALQRLIIALANECNARQLLFKELSKMVNTSIMNIDDYIDNNINYSLPNISHLLIVVDEFAELKKENPEQIKELISISRIGRSLGLHLILATQKPAGVIDDQIWSNSRFKLALKVFDEKDSNDIIKCNYAAYLNDPGCFLMKIDNSLIKGRSIYSKNDINGNDEYKVSILDSKLNILKTYKKKTKEVTSVAQYYCKKIIETSIKNKYVIRPIIFLPPGPINRDDIKCENKFVLGQVDDYINNKYDFLTYDIKDNLLIYSSRKNEINSILNTLNENCRKTIVIASKHYEGSYICDSLLYDHKDDIDYLFDYLVNHRNNDLTLVIEDVNCFLSYEDSYIQEILKLMKRKEHLNLSFVFLTSTMDLNFKLVNAFKNKIAINVLDQNDIASYFGVRSKYKGSSFFYQDELQTFVPINEEYYIRNISKFPKIIKRIPEFINADIKDCKYLIGYDEKSKDPIYLNDDIVLLSYSDNLLNKYVSNYTNIEAYIYNNSLKLDDSKTILWLGKGIFDQRLFVTGRRNDIEDNQGILIRNNIKVLIRSLNNA